MSELSGPLREAVVQRADNRCEYCQLPAQLQVGGFEVDHILPRSRGGQTELTNLALACPKPTVCLSHDPANILSYPWLTMGLPWQRVSDREAKRGSAGVYCIARMLKHLGPFSSRVRPLGR